MTQKTVDILMPVILFAIMFALIGALICNSQNTVRETYTITAEVTDKYETQVSEYNSALSLLLKTPVFSPETEYTVVVENDGECYEIKVDEDTYAEIEIGDIKKCEIKTERNEITEEYSYKGSIVEE